MLTERDIASNLKAFEKYNQERIQRALQISPSKAALAIHLVPLLLHYNNKDLPGYVSSEKSHTMFPSFSVTEDMRHAAENFMKEFASIERRMNAPAKDNWGSGYEGYTGGRYSDAGSYATDPAYGAGGWGDDDWGVKKEEKPLIQSLLIMGSVGSAAQNEKSDYDYWAVVDEAALGQEEMAYLKKKLALLEEWGDKKGTELHFFITDVTRVRGNDFGSADKESAGSSQAALLKEEFYRTAVLVAGKYPVWWVTPPAASHEEYKNAMEVISRSPTLKPSRFVDLGNIFTIAENEFFGAALWQINKAMDSPFKSVMKMALLETFIDPAGSKLLLCDELKQNVLKEDVPMRGIDPYLVMIDRLLDFYGRKKRDDVVDLISKCFYNKVSIKVSTPVMRKDRRSYKEEVMVNYVKDWKWDEAKRDDINAYGEWSFDKMAKLGEQLHAFLLETYKNLTDQLKTRAEVKTLISDSDLTVLGRKLFSFYKKKPAKIELIKRASDDALRQESVTFMPQIVRGKRPVWAIYRGNVTTNVARKQAVDYALMRKSASLPELVSWLVINRVVDSGTFMHLIPNPLPVSMNTIQELVKVINEFVPYVSISAIKNDYLLKSACVSRVLVIANFVSQPWVKNIEDVVILYRNTHGETFCESFVDNNWLKRLAGCVSVKEAPTIIDPTKFVHTFVPKGLEISSKLDGQLKGIVNKFISQRVSGGA